MSVKVIQTKICNRIDDLSNWKNSNVILEKGEIALAIVKNEEVHSESNNTPIQYIPTVMMKVGDGESTFKDLKWLAAPASDVYSWAKLATVDDALNGSTKIESFEEILAGIGSTSDYKTVLEAIAKEIEKFNSSYSDTTATGIITEINVTSDKVTVTRRQIKDSDIANDAEIAQSKIKDLTTFVTNTNSAIERFDEMLSESGKVMEFVGTYATYETLKADSTDGILHNQANHKLQKGDVVATTDDAKEYIWTTTSRKDGESETDFNNRVIYTESAIKDGVTSYTYYYWEEFGHANATDEALAQLKAEVETFHDKVFYDDTKYNANATIQHAIEDISESIEGIDQSIDDIKNDLNSNFPKLETDTDNKNYLTFHSASDDDIDTEYIIFNCGTSAARKIDSISQTT